MNKTSKDNYAIHVQLAPGQKYTSRVMQALAQAMGTHYTAHEKRCGQWGKSIGNCWGKTNKEVYLIMFELMESGCRIDGWYEILINATDSAGLNMFEKS